MPRYEGIHNNKIEQPATPAQTTDRSIFHQQFIQETPVEKDPSQIAESWKGNDYRGTKTITDAKKQLIEGITDGNDQVRDRMLGGSSELNRAAQEQRELDSAKATRVYLYNTPKIGKSLEHAFHESIVKPTEQQHEQTISKLMHMRDSLTLTQDSQSESRPRQSRYERD